MSLVDEKQLMRFTPVKKPISFASRGKACYRGGIILVLEQDSLRTKILKQPGARDGGASVAKEKSVYFGHH